MSVTPWRMLWLQQRHRCHHLREDEEEERETSTVSAVAPSFRIARTTTLAGATSASSELGVGVHGGGGPLSGVGGAPAVLAGSGVGSDGSGGGAVAGVRVPSHRLVGGGGVGGTSFLDRYRSQYRSTGL